MTLAQLIEKATAGQIFEGHLIQSANVVLQDGSTLYCSLQYRSANSRGARRGKGQSIQFNYRPPADKYSHRITKEKALELIKGA